MTTPLTIRLREFMEGEPIAGFPMRARIRVVRIRAEDIPESWVNPLTPEPVIDPSPGPRGGGARAPLKPPQLRVRPDWSVVVERSEEGTSDGDGTWTTSPDIPAMIAEFQTRYPSSDAGDQPVALLTLEFTSPAFRRTRLFGRPIDPSKATTFDFVLDFAKCIVGHTTSDQTTLWFQHHGPAPDSGRFVCEVFRAATQESSIPAPEVPIGGGLSAAASGRFGRIPAVPVARLNVPLDEFYRTGVATVAGLEPATHYTYRLAYVGQGAQPVTRAVPPGIGQTLCVGSFRTQVADTRAMTIGFGSCHRPLDADLPRWAALSARTDLDAILLIGDQIYEYESQKKVDWSWRRRYRHQYDNYWVFPQMRNALRRTPTYMVWDDHEIKDDWGSGDNTRATMAERYTAAEDAYRAFQQAHNPGGRTGALHYDFRIGPAAIFVLDSRSQRGTDASFPVLGLSQWEDLQNWADAPSTVAADVIVLAVQTPLAFLPVPTIQRIIDSTLATGGGFVGQFVGALVGAVVGFILGGPVAAGVGVMVGAGLGSYIGSEYADDAVEYYLDEPIDTFTDLADHWTHDMNEPMLARVLELLFDLANDCRPGRNGSRPRAVVVLGGDVHSGSMHLITSQLAKHVRNRQIIQITASPISNEPATHEAYSQLVQYIQEGDSLATVLARLDGGTDTPAEFGLDAAGNYRTAILDFVATNVYGFLRVRPTPDRPRGYQLTLGLEADANEQKERRLDFDLDDDTIVPGMITVRVRDHTGR